MSHLVLTIKTRMHSSRMRTGHSLTVCWSASWGVCLVPGGCLVWGGVCSQGVSGPRVCLFWGRGVGVSAWSGGVCSWGGAWSGGSACSRGVCLVWGGISQHALRQTPLPPVDRQTPVKILPWPNFVAAGNYLNELATWC